MDMSSVAAAIEAAYQDGAFPCAVVAARIDGGERFFSAIGHPDPEEGGGVPASAATIFDLASLTKPLATSLLALKAVEAGGLALDAPLSRYLPEAAGASLGATIRQLLAHTAGLPPEPRLQAFFPDPARVDRDEAIARLLAIEPEGRPGLRVVYSCTGFQLLGLALEQIGGARLSALFEREIARPLGLSDGLSDGRAAGAAAAAADAAPVATFLPAPALAERCAPTESCPWRGRRLRGMVHDESSHCLCGDGGNAGLFANLAGAEALFAVWKDGAGLLAESTVRLARALATAGLERRRALGVQLHDAETCDTPAWPEDSYGHTGFTGNSAWCAPASAAWPEVSVVSLTNRVYFGRAVTADKIVGFRRRLHGALAEAAFARTAPLV